jgi:colicin import membrane protein
MTARSPSAILLSASLHGLVVVAIFLFTYVIQTQVKEVPKVFELVAGEGDNYGATEAPALGTPGGVKIAMAVPPAPKPAAPVAPEPAPVERAAPAPAPTETKIPDLAKSVKRIEAKRRARIEAKDRAAREAEQKRLTKAEFDKQNKASKAAGARDPKVARIDAEGIAGGVVGGSTANKTGGANGKALTREEGDLLDAYFSLVKQKLRDGLEKPPGLSDALTAVADFRLGADGSISGVRISRSSGSDEFDRAVLEDLARFRAVRPPASWKGDTVSLTFRMKEEDE